MLHAGLLLFIYFSGLPTASPLKKVHKTEYGKIINIKQKVRRERGKNVLDGQIFSTLINSKMYSSNKLRGCACLYGSLILMVTHALRLSLTAVSEMTTECHWIPLRKGP